LSQKNAKLALPFAVLSGERTEPFSEEMERAAMCCFAELERGKGSGIIMKKPEEKIVFLTKFFYPLWLVQWEDQALVFDGLRTTTHTLSYKNIPNVKSFAENMQRSVKTMETFMAFLSNNLNYFQIADKEKAINIAALITEPALLKELSSYLTQAEQVEATSLMAFLSTATDESTVLSTAQELGNLKAVFKEDAALLYDCVNLINRATQNFVKTIRDKIKSIKDEYDAEAKKQESVITPKIDRINEEYDERIAKLTENFEKQLLPLRKEKIKLEKTREQTLAEIERCKQEARICATNKDEVGKQKWKEKADESKRELSEINTKIAENEEKIEETEKNKSLETFNIRAEWEDKIKEAKEDLFELEASKDAKTQLHTQEIEKLEKLSSEIIAQISNIAKLRETSLAELAKLGIKHRQRKNVLVYIPFYLVCYQSEMERRYLLFPPSMVNSVSFSAKLKGALGRKKVKQLLVSRFTATTSFLDSLLPLIKENVVFGKEIIEAGEKADMLRSKVAVESIRKGLKKLEDEGWLSEKEHELFLQRLG